MFLAVSAVSALSASAATAQDTKIPVKKLGAAEARSAEPVGGVTSMRVLSDGSVFLNDFQQRRVVLFDGALKQIKIVADTLGNGLPYGQRMPGMMPYAADSTIIVDPATLSLVVLNKSGQVARIMSAPRPQDINALASANFGTNAFDSQGRLIYRAQGGPGMGGDAMGFGGGGGGGRGGQPGGGGPGQGGQGGGQQGGQGGRGGQPGGGGGGRGGFGGDDFGGGGGGGGFGGGPGGNNQGGRGGRGATLQPDSVPILRANFDTRKTDTVTFVRVPRNEFTTTPTPEGGTRVVTKINPLPQADDWALLSDGTVAVVRVLDYHVDWYTPDGKHLASPKLPFDWKALADSEKVKIVDSLKVAAEVYTRQAQGMTQGNNQFRIAFEPVAAEKLPDFFPPIRQGSTHADADGNLWILPATSSISATDFINAAGAGRGGRGGDNNAGRGAGGPPGAAGAAGAGAAGAAAAGAGAAGGARGGRGPGMDALVPQGPVISLNYDVVNRKGELVERVQLPPGRTLAGFGPNGIMYLAVREGRSLFLERYKRPQ